jgi:hypothetical protein
VIQQNERSGACVWWLETMHRYVNINSKNSDQALE